MEAGTLLAALHTAERLKDTVRHCYTSGGRRESVAEHCWRIALMAELMRDEFPEADMDRVVTMCLIHDLGEAFTGDIPSFLKTAQDETREAALLDEWLSVLPAPAGERMKELFREMDERQTLEARIFKALDGLEAVIQHNESDIGTWSDNEFELNLHYADDKVAFSPYLSDLRERVRVETAAKIAAGGEKI